MIPKQEHTHKEKAQWRDIGPMLLNVHLLPSPCLNASLAILAFSQMLLLHPALSTPGRRSMGCLNNLLATKHFTTLHTVLSKRCSFARFL